MYKNNKSIFDKFPLLGLWLLGLAFFILLIGLAIYQLNTEPKLENIENVSGTITEFQQETKYLDRYIVLDDGNKYYIFSKGNWATNKVLDKELKVGQKVKIEYLNKIDKEVVSLEINEISIYTIEEYKIGFSKYHNFLHILFMIIAFIIILALVIISIIPKIPIKLKEKNIDNFWTRLTPKTKVIIGVVIFILGFGYFFLCLTLYGNEEGITMDNYPFIFVSMLVIPIICFIVSIIIIAKNENLSGSRKNEVFKILRTNKSNVYMELISSIIILVVGIIMIFKENLSIKEIVAIVGCLIISIIGIIVYGKKVYNISKEKRHYSKKDFVPKNVYEQLRNDEYKKIIKRKFKKLLDQYEINSEYNLEFQQIKISFKNKLYEIEITIDKNNKWLDILLDENLENKLYKLAEKEIEKELTIELLDKLLYDEEKIQIKFDKNDLSKTYVNIVNKIKEKEQIVEKLIWMENFYE